MNHEFERIIRLYMNHHPTEALKDCYGMLHPSHLKAHHGDAELASFFFLVGCICQAHDNPKNAQDFYRAALRLLSATPFATLSLLCLFNLTSATASSNVSEARRLHAKLRKRVGTHAEVHHDRLWKSMQTQYKKLYAMA